MGNCLIPDRRVRGPTTEETSLINNVYTAQADYFDIDNTVNIKKSDTLEIIEKISDDWYSVRKTETGESGIIPKNFIVQSDGIKNRVWYFGELTRLESEALLLDGVQPHGTFLIRKPETARNCKFILSIRCSDTDNHRVIHYKIKTNTSKMYFICYCHSFRCLDDLVQYYQENNDELITPLTQPCTKKNLPQLYELSPAYETVFNIPMQDITLGPQLGKGNCGIVYHGKYRNVQDVAVKMITDRATVDIREIAIMKMLRHENLVALYGIFSDGVSFYIIEEYVKNGSLLDYIKHNPLSQQNMVYMAFQIANGMDYMESKSVVHRDLAARNVLISENHKLKICDFGLSRHMENGYYEMTGKEVHLPIKWTAPEAFIEVKFTSKSDVWSYGIVLTEIFNKGQTPYKNVRNQELLEFLLRGGRMEKPPAMPIDIYNRVALKCWAWKAHERPSFKYLKQFFEHYSLF